MYSLYILWSKSQKKSYTGTTNNLFKRLALHNGGQVKSTKSGRPWILIYHEKYNTLSEARKREWFFKCTPRGGKLKRKVIINFLNGRDGGHKVA